MFGQDVLEISEENALLNRNDASMNIVNLSRL
jgi:hypothetical protein